MEHYTILDFLLVSVPEEIMLVFFVYAVLGKKHIIKPLNIFVAGIFTAAAFASTHIILYPEITLALLLNIILLAVILLFTYRINVIETIIGSLLSVISIMLIQGITVNVSLIILGYKFEQYMDSQILRLLVPIPEFVVLITLTFLILKINPQVFNFEGKGKSKPLSNKIRFIVLQLTFMLLIIVLNCRIFLYNMQYFKSYVDVFLLIVNFAVILIFTVLVIMSAFKMGESIQKEEELKRKIDGKEIMQNIDYINTLIDKNEYDEIKSIIKLIKDDVVSGMINNKRHW